MSLNYYHYCTGHGFEKELDTEWSTCEQCGDISKMHIFSFDNKEDFCKKYTYENTLTYFQNDEGSLKEDELIDKMGQSEYELEMEIAGDIYEELMEWYEG